MTVTTPDGRRLQVQEGGAGWGKPVLTFHGTPGSGRLYGPHALDAAAKGIRLISYDRPGYGGSTAQPNRTVGDCAADVRAIARALDIERLAVWGASGGGPHALACASLLPDLVVAVGSLASPAPYDADGLDYFAGMGQENEDDIRLSLSDATAGRAKAEQDRVAELAVTADQILAAHPTLVSDVDAAATNRELAEYLVAGMQEGLAPGVDGWWDDGMAHVRPWGFRMSDIRVPVQLWHGRHDRFVPFGHGEWLAAQIPGVDARLTSEDGHVTLFQHRVPGLHSWLLEHF